MGTRSLTFVKKQDIVLVNMYRQFDGYPSGHGKELAEFLRPITIINGIGQGQSALGQFANGAGCLAAQLVEHFKTEVGGIYLNPPGSHDAGQDYTYTVTVNEDRSMSVKVHSYGDLLFDGDVTAFIAFCNEKGNDE